MTLRSRTHTDSRPRDKRKLRGTVSKGTAVFALIIGLGILTLSAGPALSQSSTSSTPATEANNSSVAPGAAFAGAISNERALLDNEIERTALTTELAQATSNEERVRIVSTAIQRAEEQVTELEMQAQDPQRTANQGSTVSQAEAESVAPEARALNQTLDRLQTATVSLPATQFDDQYTNTSSIEQLEERVGILMSDEGLSTPTSETPENPSQTETSIGEPAPTEEGTTSGPSEDTDDDDDDSDDNDDDDDEDDSDNDDDDDDDNSDSDD